MKRDNETSSAMVLSQYYLSEKMLFNGTDDMFRQCWRHISKAYLVNGTLPVDQSELHCAIMSLAERLTRAETLLTRTA